MALKIALCFSGQLREGYDKFFHDHFKELSYKYDIDVYGSFWSGADLSYFKLFYPDAYIETEDFKSWRESIRFLINEIKLPEPYASWEFKQAAVNCNFYPMWYKIWRTNILTKSKKYDIVVRARTDVNYSDLDFSLFDGITIPKGHTIWGEYPKIIGINDVFAYGPPYYMDYYCSLYNYLRGYIKEGCPIIPGEGLLTYHLKQQSIYLRRTNTLVYANGSQTPYNAILDLEEPTIIQDSADLVFNLTGYEKRFIVNQ